MSVNKLIIDTLKPQNIPVHYQIYEGSESTYITFHIIDERGGVFADDDEQNTRYTVQVDVWSKGDYTNIVSEVKEKLKAVGFIRSNETEIYENDTGIYHKIIRLNYYREVL